MSASKFGSSGRFQADDDQDLRQSFRITSPTPQQSQGSSSKAVLAALRALQDKIRRLEAEKLQAQDETKQLRLQLQNQEIESDRVKQKEKLNLQKNIHEVRSAYENAISEKTELEAKLSKLDERNRELRSHSDELFEKIRLLEVEKHQLEFKCKDLESKYLHLEVQLDKTQSRERELATKMKEERRQLEDEKMTISIQLQQAQDDLEMILKNHGFQDKRVVELDELVGQLLHLNEVLVHKVSESNASNISLRKILGISKRHPIPSGPTESSKAKIKSTSSAAAAAAVSTPRVPPPPTSSRDKDGSEDEDILRLHTLHKMYKGLAKALQEARISNELPPPPPSSIEGGSGTMRMTNSRSPASPLAAAKAIHRRRQQQEYTQPNTQSGYMNDNIYNKNKFTDNDFDDTNMALLSASEFRKIDRESDGRNTTHPMRASMDTNAYMSTYKSPYKKNGSNIMTSASNTGYYDDLVLSPTPQPLSTTTTTNGNTDIQVKNVINSLEEEYENINSQYRKILALLQNEQQSTLISTNNTPEIQQEHEDKIYKYSEELMNIMKQLQRKREQIRALKK